MKKLYAISLVVVLSLVLISGLSIAGTLGRAAPSYIVSNAYGAAASVCSIFSDATTCAKALGYADPRQFGAYCSTNFNTNNSTQDDTAGLQAALNTGVPVMIPYPGCKLANKLNFSADGQTIFSFGQGGRYNSNYPGNPYIFMPNDLWTNKATSLNCAVDTKGYDNVTIRGVAFRSNYNLVGSVAVCNSVGIQSGRGAAFVNLENVACLNMGNCVGAAMTSYFDDDPGSPGNTYGNNTPCTPVSSGSQDVLRTNVFQIRAKGLDMIGNCSGIYGNMSDMHLTDFYGANISHNVVASLAGFGSAWDISNGRIEYSGFGQGPVGSKTYFNDGAGMYFDAPFGYNVSNVTCDHQYGSCISGGPNAKNIQLANIHALGSYYTAIAGMTHQCHFWFDGTRGVSATGISTQRNSVNTPYVACFKNGTDVGSVVRTPDYINWNGTGGAATSSGATGQWQTAYFLLTNIGSNFSYNVPGVGIQMANITGYTETEYNIGNSSTAFTISLDNGTFQKVTATGNATVTMPTATAGKSFTLRYYTGAGSFTATFTGVKWSGGTAPTLTTTASRMDIMSFVSDGTNWYGTYTQNYTP